MDTRTFQTLVLSASVTLTSCGSPAPAATQPSASASNSCDPERDRQAILAMRGSYAVEFRFEETTPLTAGYEPKPEKTSRARELLLVIEDTPQRVTLQHLLVMDPKGKADSSNVTKHWRQEWVFEDRELLEFAGQRRWNRRTLTEAEAKCAWSQAVFEVDDAPRYESSGRFRHGSEGSVWQSGDTFRPLPRREYTKRSDYDVLLGVNRHRILPTGWEHEQDNVKLVLEPRHALVRELGMNTYVRGDPSETEPAEAYWRATAEYWKVVRAEWARVFAVQPNLVLLTEIDGKRLYEHLLPQADQPLQASVNRFIRDNIWKYVAKEPAPAQTTNPTSISSSEHAAGAPRVEGGQNK